jgi:deoxyribodipyrimidine photolyase
MRFHVSQSHIEPASNVREYFITRDQFNLAGLSFGDPSLHFGQLCCRDLWRNVFDKAANQSLGQFSANLRRERHCFAENLLGCGHGEKLRSADVP